MTQNSLRALVADTKRSLSESWMSPTQRARFERILRREESQIKGERPEIRTLGGFAAAAAIAAGTGERDSRLMRAPTGAGEVDPTTGGFLIPAEIARPIFENVFTNRNSTLSHFRKFTIPEKANGITVPAVDETSRQNGYRWGGLIADFISEEILGTAQFPKLKKIAFGTSKLMALVPISNEVLADAENLTAYLVDAISDEFNYQLERRCLTTAGVGANVPLSIARASALITIPAVSGQKPATVVAENALAMWNALPSASRKFAIWAGSESVARQIFTNEAMAGFQASYPAAGSANPDDLPRMFGRPFIETDVLPALGITGDLLLIDPRWFAIASKPMTTALSGDIGFLTGQTYLRLVWRLDAQPLVSAPLTASDGTQRSPFVALGVR